MPQVREGDIAERKARRGNVFWGCTNYPKCDFTSNYKPVAQPCPDLQQPLSCGEDAEVAESSSSARTRRRAPRRKPSRRSGGKKTARARAGKQPLSALTRSALAMRLLRRRPRLMDRWLRSRRRKKELQPA